MTPRSSLIKQTLPNGVRVVTERMPWLQTVAIGLWMDLGSRDEDSQEGGITHFIEHMLFKGTQNRDVLRLARDVNALGGNFNAFTSPEQLCLHAVVISQDMQPALETLGEMLVASEFPKSEFELERGVILEEIAECEDQAEDYVEELFYKTIWRDDPLGRPVTGPRRNVESFARNQLVRYWRRHFSPERLVVTIAGGFDRRTVNPIVKKLFGDLTPSGSAPRRKRPSPLGAVSVDERELEQVHFCYGTEAPRRGDDKRFALAVFNALYGGGMGSRLSNEIREKRGLAYSIYSGFNNFRDVGSFVIRGSTSPENLPKVLDLSLKELRSLYAAPPSADEVSAARDQCMRSYLLAQESTMARMNSIGENELTDTETLEPADVVSRLEAITPKQIQEVAIEVLEGKPVASALVGPVNGHRHAFKNLTF